MLETFSNFIADWVYRQSVRFGWWSLLAPITILLGTGFLIFCGCDQHSGWPTEAEAKMAAEREAAENKIEDERVQALVEARKQKAAKAAVVAAPLAAAPKKPDPAPTVKKPSPLELPEDLAKWSDDDYFIARRTGDKRLMAALDLRAKAHVQDPAEAAFLVRLLDPAIPEHLREKLAGASSGNAASGVQPAPLVTAITAALSVNNTPAATEVLAQMACGAVAGVDPKIGAEAALRELAGSATPQTEATFLKLLIAPAPSAALKPAADPQGMQRARVAALLKVSASRRLRIEIARKMTDPALATETRALLGTILKDSVPDNFDAQLVLYRTLQTDAATRTAIEKFILASGSDALGWLLGMPDKINLGANSEWPQFVVRRLGRDEFAEQVRRRLDAAVSMQESAGTIAMAATASSDAMRQALAQTLVRHWEDGPVALQAAMAQPSLMVDPGWLLVLKAAERKAARAKSATGSGRQTPKGAANHKKWEEYKTKLKEQWGKLAEDAVRKQCNVLRTVALARDDAAHAPGAQPVSEVKPPVPLPAGAKVVAAVEIDWAMECAARAGASQVDPLLVTYCRIEGRLSPLKLMQWYRRQLKGCEERKLPDGAWFDALDNAADGRKRSIDVRITEKKAVAGRPADEEREMTVDIVVVEARDPLPRSDAGDSPEG